MVSDKPDNSEVKAALEVGLCDRVGCDKEGIWTPILLVYREGHKDADQVALGLKVCGPHAHALQVEDVLDDSGWEYICKEAFDARGFERPIRERTKVAVVR